MLDGNSGLWSSSMKCIDRDGRIHKRGGWRHCGKMLHKSSMSMGSMYKALIELIVITTFQSKPGMHATSRNVVNLEYKIGGHFKFLAATWVITVASLASKAIYDFHVNGFCRSHPTDVTCSSPDMDLAALSNIGAA